MESKKKFDKLKYNVEYRKTHKREFRVDLNIDEYEELCILLKEKNITKAQFLRDCIKKIKEK